MPTLEAQVVSAEQAGREDDAIRIMVRLLELDPGHPGALRSLGQKAYRRGDLAGAREYFRGLVDAEGSNPQNWTLLALACKGLKDDAAEDEAIRKALTLEPRNLLALVARANLLERQGKTHEAAIAHGAVAMVAPPPDRVHPDLRSSVAYSIAYRDHYDRSCGTFLDQYLEKHLRDCAGDDLRRFRDSVDIMVGRKKRYDSHPSHYFYPRLAPIEFFDRDEFPWIESVEARHRGGARRVPRGGALRAGLLALHRESAAPSARPVAGTEPLAALERVPPDGEGGGRRGECRALPGDHAAAGRRFRSRISRGARPRRCSRS